MYLQERCWEKVALGNTVQKTVQDSHSSTEKMGY